MAIPGKGTDPNLREDCLQAFDNVNFDMELLKETVEHIDNRVQKAVERVATQVQLAHEKADYLFTQLQEGKEVKDPSFTTKMLAAFQEIAQAATENSSSKSA